jgi:hypothetical protein
MRAAQYCFMRESYVCAIRFERWLCDEVHRNRAYR